MFCSMAKYKYWTNSFRDSNADHRKRKEKERAFSEEELRCHSHTEGVEKVRLLFQGLKSELWVDVNGTRLVGNVLYFAYNVASAKRGS